ncbi:MAG TPA: VWA domain-containing protein, partial [Rariglobus sp.]
MIFFHSHVLWCLPVVFLAGAALYGWSRRVRRRRLSLFVTFSEADALLRSRQETVRIVGHGLLVMGLALLVVALARPLVGPKTVNAEREGIDVMVAIDVSKSMLTPDLPPRRLEAARHALQTWLRGRSNDRVGLILFAGDAFLQIPLTSDHAAVATLLEAVRPTGRGGSNLENPIQTAIDVFSRVQGKSRALILVTDGENHEGDPAARAAEGLQRHGIRTYTLGVGTTAGGKVPNIVQSGVIGGEVRNSYGVGIHSKLDSTLLRAIAAAGGGAYHSLGDTPDAMQNLQHQQLDQLLRDTRVIEATDYAEWFALPLLAGLLCLIAERFTPWLGRPRRSVVAVALLAVLGLTATTPRAEAADPNLKHQQKLIEDGQASVALAALREEAVRRPDDPFALYNLGVAAYSSGDYEEAVKTFETLLALPDNQLRSKALGQLGNARVRLGERLLVSGSQAGAAVEFERALASYEHPEAGGRGLEKNNRVVEGVFLDTLETVADTQLAQAQTITDNWTQRRVLQKALGALDQILSRDPKRASALRSNTQTRSLLIGNIVEEGHQKLKQGAGSVAVNRFKDAYVPLREAYEMSGAALNLDPQDPRAQAFDRESRTAFSGMLVIQGREEFEAAMKIAKLANRLGLLNTAETRADEALGLDPENKEAADLRAVIRDEIEKTALADGDALVAAANKVKTPASTAVNLTQAISRFQRVLEVNAENTHAQTQLAALLPRLAEVLLQMGQTELDAAKKAIAGDQTPNAAQIRKALAHLGKADEALGQAGVAGMNPERLKPVVEEVHALAEKLMAML